MYQSVATIDAPEFINLKPLDINPLISKCEIKVLYVGENRNKTYFSKEILQKMSTTLRGTPIVGTYNAEKQDFGDHGKRVIIDHDGIKKECTTRPYGFIPTDARVWFQKFEDYDEINGSIIREYLMTEGYLWTSQYPECQSAIDEGKGHSMEVDDKTMTGNWVKDYNSGNDFFLVDGAIFYKLCILGDDIEPCFEGSSVTAPKVSASFSKEDSEEFMTTLYSMMEEVQSALKISEGGKKTVVKTDETLITDSEDVVKDFSKQPEDKKEKDEPAKDEPKEGEKKEEEPAEDPKKKPVTDCALEKDKKEEEEPAKAEESKKEEEPKQDDNDSKKKKDYALLEQQYTELQSQYNLLKETCDALTDFKNKVEDKEKDDLIASFYMLDDEDKKDVIANKSQYSLDDIEAKLSVICVRKKVNFNLEEDSQQPAPTTYNLNSDLESDVPEWLRAVDAVKSRK